MPPTALSASKRNGTSRVQSVFGCQSSFVVPAETCTCQPGYALCNCRRLQAQHPSECKDAHMAFPAPVADSPQMCMRRRPHT